MNDAQKKIPPSSLREFGEFVRSMITAPFAGRLVPSTGPFQHVTERTRRVIQRDIRKNPDLLFQMRHVRELVAEDRARHFLASGKVDSAQTTGGVARGTVEHNLAGAHTAANLDRPTILALVASSIERIRKNMEKTDVLSIGPRSEIELFGFRAVGFPWERIKAIDLFSYSPYVKAGDVHAMSFPDNSFDVVCLGWVLAYSKDQSGAIREVIRVLRPGGIAIVASDYSSDQTHSRDRVDSTHMQTSEQMLSLFGNHVKHVYFRHDPDMPHTHMIMVAVEVQKP